ncbi:M48 family metalloprotease [Candidatus Parcubacteria bacterium]|uniref:Protease HtpX homolog n=1 Tax=Candidatus Kaiserbacteria bacterium CG10_big_fil_rev_8_21_14_0_10_47_16 TaxID=1974608 RepID=A0A2H0UDB1_9BACT|nr:M48 family metalloprotease [Candidatus Parcubacteria bacterium]PIR84377.1 MAG: zinc metalloprotease HtpX [Candidatus Kaiserbacteria bacterium CG10_big_fil_rev_8_21_14_0_10_47_16]
MATLYTQQGANIRKTWLLMTVFLIIVIAIGYFIAWYIGNPFILYIAVAFAIIMNVTSYWFSDTIVVKMTGAKPIDRDTHRELWNVVENLAITAGLPMPKVYIVEDPAPNAFATGRDPEHAVVAVTSGILQILDRSELEGVIAHELSHVGNRDMLVSTVAVVLAGFVAIVADIFLRMTMFGGGDNRDRNPVFLIIGIVGIVLAPIAAQLIKLAISRKREYLADASGALLTRYPEGLASALEKISAYARPMKRANNATAHLFIADPFGKDKKGIGQKISGLFQTHPPAQDRIRILRGME